MKKYKTVKVNTMQNKYNTVGERVTAVLNELKNLKKISGDVEISTQLGYKSSSSITEMKKNRSLPTSEFLDLLTNKYGVSRDYIMEGIEPKFLNSNDLNMEKGGLEFLRDYAEEILAIKANLKVLMLLEIENKEALIKLSDMVTGQVSAMRSFSEISLDVEHRITREIKLGLDELRLSK